MRLKLFILLSLIVNCQWSLFGAASAEPSLLELCRVVTKLERSSIVNSQTPKALLDEVVQRAFAQGYVDIDFSVAMGDAETGGNIRVQGNKFVLQAAGMTTWFDGQTQWTYVEANEEVNVSQPSKEELQALNPYAWMSLYEQGYELKFAETSVPGVRKVIMTTTEPREEMQSIVLLIHETELYPVRISMASRGGLDVTVIDIDRFEVKNRLLPDEVFVFNKADYPGVEVIDLR